VPRHIADEMLSGLLGANRDIPAPHKPNWPMLLTTMPKQVTLRLAA
jgi:hypothetical protein